MKQIDFLNQLRAVSAIIVVFSHIGCTNKLLGGNPGGFAVCIFFLLSGFLTVLSTEKKSGTMFLTKRYLRVAPLYYGMTIACFLIASLKPELFNTANPSFINLIKSLLFIPYVSKSGLSRPILDVGWYINVLMLFYVIFKISILISHKYRATISSFVLLMLTILGEYFIADNSIFLLYRNGMVTLAMGMLIATVYLRKESIFKINIIKNKSVTVNIAMIVFYLIFTLLFCYLEINPYIKLFLPIVLFTTVLFFDHANKPLKFFDFINRISMSIYLTHEFVVKGVSRLIFNLDEMSFISISVSILCVILVVIIAVPVNYIFEKKISGILISKCQEKQKND